MSAEEGLINVDDDAAPPAPPAAPVASAPPEPAAPVAPADPPDVAQVDEVEVGGAKYVPLAAVKAERERRQTAESRLQQTERENAELKPYADLLRNNPGLLTRPAAPEPPAAPTVDPRLEALAKSLDLYTPEGKPDLERAKTITGIVASQAQSIAQEAIRPYAQQTAQEKSNRNFQAALGMKDAAGRSPSPAALKQVWGIMPVEQTADPNVAGILALTALGMDALNTKPAPPAPGPILVTEPAGGHPHTRPGLSALERNVAKDRGIPEAKFAELTQGFQSGRSHQLED